MFIWCRNIPENIYINKDPPCCDSLNMLIKPLFDLIDMIQDPKHRRMLNAKTSLIIKLQKVMIPEFYFAIRHWNSPHCRRRGPKRMGKSSAVLHMAKITREVGTTLKLIATNPHPVKHHHILYLFGRNINNGTPYNHNKVQLWEYEGIINLSRC